MSIPSKKGLPYTKKDLDIIKREARKGTSTPDIADIIKRTIGGLRNKASREGIPLQPRDK
jgi:hypothetical protein